MPIEIDCPYCGSKPRVRCIPRNVFARTHAKRWHAVGIYAPTADHIVQNSQKMDEMNGRTRIGVWGNKDGTLPEVSEAYSNNE